MKYSVEHEKEETAVVRDFPQERAANVSALNVNTGVRRVTAADVVLQRYSYIVLDIFHCGRSQPAAKERTRDNTGVVPFARVFIQFVEERGTCVYVHLPRLSHVAHSK